MEPFERVLTRDVPLIQTEAWSDIFTKALPQLFGFPWPVPLFCFRNATVESWRPTTFHTDLARKCAAWVAESPDHEQKILAVLHAYAKAAKAARAYQSIPSGATPEELLLRIEQILSVLEQGLGLWPGYWFTDWDMMAKEGKGGANFPDELLLVARDIRAATTIFADVAGALYAHLWHLAEKKAWPTHLLKFIRSAELRAAVAGEAEPDVQLLRERNAGYLYYHGKIYTGSAIREVIRDHHFVLVEEEVSSTTTLVHGRSAYSGHVQGTARIVVNRDQCGDVAPGDILITPMTEAYFLPILARCAAIVTDEGGVLCHAAIFARELRKPCVIGTKIATKVFKNGDRVEVDAIKGIVRRI